MAAGLTIAEVAALKGCTAHTLRYYERAGLLPPVTRAGNGHRRYSQDDVEWVDFLLCLRQTGMSIAGMKKYVDLALAGDRTAPRRLAMLEAHARQVAERVESLQENLRMLDHKILGYREGIAAVLRAWNGGGPSAPARGPAAAETVTSP